MSGRRQTRAGKKKHRGNRIAAYAQCECGEYDRRAFIKTGKGNKICRNCNGKLDAPKGYCMACLSYHPVERDEPLGWRVSDYGMLLCLNCHAKKSAATSHITNAMARELLNASPEERPALKVVYARIQLEYISLVCRNILQRIGYPSPHLDIGGDDASGNKPKLCGAASSLLHGS